MCICVLVFHTIFLHLTCFYAFQPCCLLIHPRGMMTNGVRMAGMAMEDGVILLRLQVGREMEDGKRIPLLLQVGREMEAGKRVGFDILVIYVNSFN